LVGVRKETWTGGPVAKAQTSFELVEREAWEEMAVEIFEARAEKILKAILLTES
jgi:hypothetical protein